MPYLDNVTNIKMAKAVREVIGQEHGFIGIVIDLSDGAISLVSDAPSQKAVIATLAQMLKSLEEDEFNSYWLGDTPDSLN